MDSYIDSFRSISQAYFHLLALKSTILAIIPRRALFVTQGLCVARVALTSPSGSITAVLSVRATVRAIVRTHLTIFIRLNIMELKFKLVIFNYYWRFSNKTVTFIVVNHFPFLKWVYGVKRKSKFTLQTHSRTSKESGITSQNTH